MKNKKAAMEMSVGTIVTIVLLMTVLILGLVLVRTIFAGAKGAIDGITKEVENEITKLFAEDNSRKIVVYPTSRSIVIKKGTDNLGFGFSIRNIKQEEEVFSYEITATEISCNMKSDEAENMISLGRKGSNIALPPGDFMVDPIFVRFNIPDSAPPCEIRYNLQVKEKSGNTYAPTQGIDLTIKSK